MADADSSYGRKMTSLDAYVPYLEVHHMLRLADDGPDEASNVAAVCPNCHRALHFSIGRQALAQRLSEFIEQREQAIAMDLGLATLAAN